jgi:[protein-PII] uridylyltransferase
LGETDPLAPPPDLPVDPTHLPGTPWCAARTTQVDEWLGRLYAAADAPPTGVALVAVGGYGRAELCPQSDLDVLLLHAKGVDVARIAERLWYPIWDSGMKLGHSVRTTKEALKLASDDLDTATSLLDLRLLAGDGALLEELRTKAADQWVKRGGRWLGRLAESTRKRHEQAGEIAFLLEPDLKEGRGGLRDVHALRWAEAARRVLLAGDDEHLGPAYETILRIRVALHLVVGRPTDVLHLQDQDAVAEQAGYGNADVMMKDLAVASRAIAWTSDEAWDRIESALEGPLGRSARSDRELAEGVVLRDGEVVVLADADVAGDPVLLLRVAAAAAERDARIERHSLERLARESPPLPLPWPDEARERFVALLLAGRPAIRVVEALDQRGLFTRVLPEWETVRSKPQRNAYHRFTVDRHLSEVASNASELADRVARPDLLVVGALFHDLGKGLPGDHTDVGIVLAEQIGPRMGFDAEDTAVLADMVRHHLLLPDIAIRRDLDDPATIRGVAEAVGDTGRLELLAALTEADSMATGTAAWGDWKKGLLYELVRRTDAFLGGEAPPEEAFPDDAQRALMAEGRATRADGTTLTVVAPDRPGHLSRVAGVVALHGLDVLAASAHSEGGTALTVVRVAEAPDRGWERLVAELEDVLEGEQALQDRIAERARTYVRRRSSAQAAAVDVRFFDDASDRCTVVEVHAPDRVGVLSDISGAFASCGLDVQRALVQTIGDAVVDTFYVAEADGSRVSSPDRRAEVEDAVRGALEARAVA